MALPSGHFSEVSEDGSIECPEPSGVPHDQIRRGVEKAIIRTPVVCVHKKSKSKEFHKKMIKIAIIGSGSEWGRRLGVDILSYDWPDEVTISMMDVSVSNLEPIVLVTRKAIDVHDRTRFKVEGTTSREDALKSANYVLASFAIGGNAYCGPVYAADITIPMKYGIYQSVADTLGAGGIFRALRTAPVMISLLKDMERLCPEALLLNYVNPMAILTWIANLSSPVRSIGLCHSVQGTSRMLSSWLGKPWEEISYKVGGINHMAWFTELKWKGEDMLPQLRRQMNDQDKIESEPIRTDICRTFDSFVTESSQHMSEYVPYYRKRKELLTEYNIQDSHVPVGAVLGTEQTYRFLMEKKRYSDASGRPEKVQRQIAGEEPIVLEKSYEYASEIMMSMETNNPLVFNGNVINHGCIENLPYDCCVEVACTADCSGISPHYFGKLPSHLAALCQTNINVQRLTVEAIMENDLQKAFYALTLDPLTSSVCSTREIRVMFNEMVEAEKEYLQPYYK